MDGNFGYGMHLKRFNYNKIRFNEKYIVFFALIGSQNWLVGMQKEESRANLYRKVIVRTELQRFALGPFLNRQIQTNATSCGSLGFFF